MQRRGAAVYGDAVGGSTIVGETLLKAGDGRPEDEIRGLYYAGDGDVDLGLDLTVLCFEIEKRNQVTILATRLVGHVVLTTAMRLQGAQRLACLHCRPS